MTTEELILKTASSEFWNTFFGFKEELKNEIIEFAKHHVIEALKAASENVELKTEELYTDGLGNEEDKLYDIDIIVDKDSILTAYPLSNIT